MQLIPWIRTCFDWRALAIAMVLLTLNGNAQDNTQDEKWLLGAGITYCGYADNPGVNLNVTYRLAGNLHIGPDFSAILTDKVKENGRIVKRKELEYNLNATWLFDITETFSLYPLVGYNFSKITVHPLGLEADERWVGGWNCGAGVEIPIRRLHLFSEGKFVTGLRKYDVSVGILIKL